ncbi:MAG: dimethylhistidine N-methyltransferase [Candidatus Melainabacteria bacterium RIFCSPHIGHO2_02_FULL_34_12]|nr:MAG: dimethylhistidine N-methyltransferase [Candidatus Melainabacteria bacterium RIFCSPHIGHO2_02_FULL_34_12]
MTATYQILNDENKIVSFQPKDTFLNDIYEGLSKLPKSIPSQYFYDKKGSDIFTKITKLEEYYLPKASLEILDTHKDEIAKLMKDEPFRLIELGAGDGKRTKILLECFFQKKSNFTYVPIDISEAAMSGLIKLVENNFPLLNTKGLVTEYFEGIRWLEKENYRKNFVLFMGSNIGNFNKAEEIKFLTSLKESLNKDDFVLIGFDLKKDIALINNAYNDSKGITKEFNLNLLRRINDELGGDFNLNDFDFYASYNPLIGSVESYLISLKDQNIYIKELDKTFNFKKWEPIFTEHSFKYSEEDIKLLAYKTGYKIEKQFYDSKHFFTQSIWKV